MRRHFNLTAAGRLAGRYIPKDSQKIDHPDGLGVVYIYNERDRPSAIAYRGTANKRDFHTIYRSVEARQAAIDSFFASLTERKTRIAKWRSERSAKNPERAAKGDFSLTTVAQMIREALAASFPGVKFSVRSSSYSGGCSITAFWTDGPTQGQVTPLLKCFEGATFDGMIDLKSYVGQRSFDGRPVEFHVDYVFAQRTESYALIRDAARQVAFESGLPLLKINDNGCAEGGSEFVPFSVYLKDDGTPGIAHGGRITGGSNGGDWYNHLIGQWAHLTSFNPDNTARDAQMARHTSIDEAADAICASLDQMDFQQGLGV